MPFVYLEHAVKTLSGSAQQLVTTSPNSVRDISLQADPANANPIYVAATNAVSSTVWMWRIPAPVGGEPAPPFIYETRDGVADVWVLGTNNEKLHIGVARYGQKPI